MIEIKLEEASSLTLEMKIEGNVNGDKPELRFTVMSEGLRYSFESQSLGNGVYQIDFPIMEGKIGVGQYDAQVEIMVGGKYFVPLQETVNFTKEVKPVVKLAEHIKKMDASIEVKLGAITHTKTINDVRALIGILSEGEIDSEFALRALNSLVIREGIMTEQAKIVPKGDITENEVLAVLRLIRKHGTDINGKEPIWEGIREVSDRAGKELRGLLAEKGVSARVLRESGFD